MDKIPWPECMRYMTLLHDLQRWATRELDCVQIEQTVSPTLPAAWDQIEAARGELLAERVNGDR